MTANTLCMLFLQAEVDYSYNYQVVPANVRMDLGLTSLLSCRPACSGWVPGAIATLQFFVSEHH